MSNYKTVWVDGQGDSRKPDKTSTNQKDSTVDPKNLCLKVRRLTSGKGRTVIEISDLPKDKKWCQQLSKDLKKSLGVGGTYKNEYIEIHGEKIDGVTALLDKKNLKWKKTGG